MRIREILWQNRRDFKAIYECEHCGFTFGGMGYDDAMFHNQVIPDMTCRECGKKAPESYEPRQTKYAEWEVV